MKVYEAGNNDYMIVLDKGEDLFKELLGFAASRNIKAGYLLQGIGMFEETVMGYYNGKEYDKEEIPEPVELLSLGGNLSLKNGEPLWHIHATLAKEGGEALGGHIFSAKVAVTAELYFRAMDSMLERKEVSPNLWLIC